jgi:hypothetical protein
MPIFMASRLIMMACSRISSSRSGLFILSPVAPLSLVGAPPIPPGRLISRPPISIPPKPCAVAGMSQHLK